MAIAAALNRLTYAEPAQVTALFEELIGRKVGEHFRPFPPLYADCGIAVGAGVFIHQNCTFHLLADMPIEDDVMIGPNVSLITSKHPMAPSRPREYLLGKPITLDTAHGSP